MSSQSGDSEEVRHSEMQAQELAMQSDDSDEATSSTTNKAGEVSMQAGAMSADVTAMEQGIDRLLQKHRNDIMYELRALRMGDRLVTGDHGAREAVEGFFNQATETPPPSSRQRPESVVVEVSALVERRPVSNILNSSQFRRNLENAIRGSFVNASRRDAHPAETGRALNRTSLLSSESNSHNLSPPPPPAPSLPMRSQPVVTHAGRQTTMSNVQSHARQMTPTLRDQHTNSTDRAESWIQQLPRDNLSRPNIAWESLEEAQRENLVAEISELLHHQLVTSTLHSEFRSQLEDNVMRHLQNIPSDGRRVEESIRSLAPTQAHRRNDFSHLGITTAAPHEDSFDNMSVISATAAVTMPFAQSNAALRQEIQSLKTQMTAMQQMMQMSFELQLEMQRSLRQEVAAGLNSQTAQPGDRTTTSTWSRSVSEGHCLICLDRPVDSVLCQCGHMCVCQACGLQLRAREHNCPVCRAPIRDVVRVYRSNPT